MAINPYKAKDFDATNTPFLIPDGTATKTFDRITQQASDAADRIVAEDSFDKGVVDQQSSGTKPVDEQKGLFGMETISSAAYNKGARLQLSANLHTEIESTFDQLYNDHMYDPDGFEKAAAEANQRMVSNVPARLLPQYTQQIGMSTNASLQRIRLNKRNADLDQQRSDVWDRMSTLRDRISSAVLRDPASTDIDGYMAELKVLQDESSRPTKDGPALFNPTDMAKANAALRQDIASDMLSNEYRRQGGLDAKKAFIARVESGQVAGVQFRDEVIPIGADDARRISGILRTDYNREKADADTAKREADAYVREATAVMAAGYAPENQSTVDSHLAQASPEVRKDYNQALSWSSTIRSLNTMSAAERRDALQGFKDRFGANGWTPEEVRAYRTMEARDDQIGRSMAADPLGGAAEAADVQLAPLDFSDPRSVARRSMDRDRLESMYKVPIPIMTKAEAKALGTAFPKMDETQKQAVLAQIGTSLGVDTGRFRKDDFDFIMKAVSEDNPGTAAMMSRPFTDDVSGTGLAQRINRLQAEGLSLIKDPVTGKDWTKNQADLRREFLRMFGETVPQTGGGLAIGDRAASMVADQANQIYTGLIRQKGDYSGEMDESLAKKAFAMALGSEEYDDLPRIAGHAVAPPKIGMKDFEDRWSVLSDDDLRKGGGSLPQWRAGTRSEEVTAGQLRDKGAVPVMVSPGRYILVMPNGLKGTGSSSFVLSRPDGRAFVLDWNAVDGDITKRLGARTYAAPDPILQ